MWQQIDGRFPLHQDGSQVLAVYGRWANTYDTGNLTVRGGRQDANISVLVADIEDCAILGMEFPSAVDAKIDLVEQQLVINGEEIDCCNQNYHAGRREFNSGRTNTQGLKITEERVLPL